MDSSMDLSFADKDDGSRQVNAEVNASNAFDEFPDGDDSLILSPIKKKRLPDTATVLLVLQPFTNDGSKNNANFLPQKYSQLIMEHYAKPSVFFQHVRYLNSFCEYICEQKPGFPSTLRELEAAWNVSSPQH